MAPDPGTPRGPRPPSLWRPRAGLSSVRRPRAGLTSVRESVRSLFGRTSGEAAPTFVPADPRAALSGQLDPDLVEIRRLLAPFGRRLWLRRVVRRAWIVVAIAVLAELLLWTVARFVPVE